MKKYWNKISKLGINSQMRHFERRSIILVNQLSIIIGIILLIYMPLSAFENVIFFPILITAILFYFIVPVLNYRQHYLFSRLYFFFISLVLIAILSILPGKGSGERYFFIATGILPLLLFHKPRFIYGLSVLNALSFIFICYVQYNFAPIIKTPNETKILYLIINIISVLILVFLSLQYFKKDNDNFETQLLHTNTILDKKNKEILASITYAQRIQQAILPPDKLIQKLIPQNFVLFKPKDIVSGDFYWFEKVNNLIYFAAVDCTGHGVPGALVSIVGYNGLNQALKEFKLEKPSEILDKLNELVEQTFIKSEFEVKDGMDIALCCIDLENYKLSYVGAHNPLYIVHNSCLTEIKADRQPIGKYQNRFPFKNHVVDLEKNDCCYIFSDGFADQFGGEKNRKFKYKALKQLLIDNSQKLMKEQKEILNQTFEAWKGNYEQIDDVLIIGIKV
ncbi:MAG: SpoIIE family protein phosphatase [Chlorobi bacterium]|nr:SpoIIE family protein phosphatase [Chlorobiota bacterium]